MTEENELQSGDRAVGGPRAGLGSPLHSRADPNLKGRPVVGADTVHWKFKSWVRHWKFYILKTLMPSEIHSQVVDIIEICIVLSSVLRVLTGNNMSY